MNYLQVVEVLGRMNKNMKVLKIEGQIVFYKRNIEREKKEL